MAGDGGLFALPDTDRERRIAEVVAELRKQPGWPADDAADRRFAVELIESWPTADLVKEIGKWRYWMATKFKAERGVEVNLRARIRTWFRRDRAGRGGASRRQIGDGVRRAGSGAPSGPADFAGEDGQARPW